MLLILKNDDRYGEETFLDVTYSSDKKNNNGLLMTETCIVKGVEYHNCRNRIFSKSLHDAIKSKEKSDKKSDDVNENDIKDYQSKSKKEEYHF